MAVATITPARRKQVLRVLFLSLILDLISFTFILPLFPSLLSFYRKLEASSPGSNTILNQVLAGLNAYKRSFAKPINDRHDVVLLGGALGALFSLLQAISSPFIGYASDRYGRRKTLLLCMVGNILSVFLWVVAADFRTFLAHRIVGGLSEGNVQLATAIATDISDESQRGSTMAMVGVCFSIAFTFGPALGAWLSSIKLVSANPFATAAGFSLFLIVIETLYLYFYLPETHLRSAETENSTAEKSKAPEKVVITQRTNPHWLLNMTHFFYLLTFSGMEFSLPFLTFDLFGYPSSKNGRLLGFIGVIASIFQGGFTRRLHPLRAVQTGVVSCAVAFFLLSNLTSERQLYAACALLAITSATVVTGLNGLSSFEASATERGGKMGAHRSWGQFGRALGPILFCTTYWWAGREKAYFWGSLAMLGVCGLVFVGLRIPPGTEVKRRAKKAFSS